MAAGYALTARERQALQRRVVEAAAEQLLRVGPDKFRAATVVEQFADTGIARSSLYRWIAAAHADGKVGQAASQAVRRRVAQRVRKRKPAPDAAAEIAEKLPELIKPDDIVPSRSGSIIDHLRACVDAATKVMAFAKAPDGNVRNPKLLLLASEHLRRCAETVQRIHERIFELQRIEEFHRQIIEEVRKESPACAERILVQLDQLSQRFGAVDSGAVDHRAAA